MSEQGQEEYIIYDMEDVSEEDQILVEAYWMLNPDKPRQFYYYVADIEKEFELDRKALSELIRNNYWLTGSGEKFFCVNCGARTFVKLRAEYLELQKRKSESKCDECKLKEEREIIQREELELAERLRVQAKFEEECLFADYSVHDLTYIETFFIFLWLSNKELSTEVLQIVSKSNSESVTGVEELDAMIISQLAAKGVVLELDEEFISKHEINKVLDLPSIKFETVLRKSKQYINMYEFCERLYERFCEDSVTVSDVKEISFVVESIRLNNLYSVVDWLEREHRIKIKINTKLDGLLRHLSNRLSLSKCVYVMYYNAKDVAAFIHSKKPDFNVLAHLFTSFTDTYLKRLDKNSWTVEYARAVPDSVHTSALEVLICERFFETEYNWWRLSVDEVVSEWVGALNVLEGDS